MNLLFRRIGIFFLITSGLLSFAKAGSTYSLVTAREYCQFLNNSPSSDSKHRYDDAMSSDPYTASILRQGKPGGCFYEVIAGRENYPVYYVSFSDEKLYYDSLQEEAPEDLMTDALLKSNSRAFQVSQLENSQALFFGTADSQQKSDWNPYAKNILAAAAVAVILKGGCDYCQGEIGDRPVLADRSRVDVENRVRSVIGTETPETSDSSMTSVAFPMVPGWVGNLANETRLAPGPNVQEPRRPIQFQVEYQMIPEFYSELNHRVYSNYKTGLAASHYNENVEILNSENTPLITSPLTIIQVAALKNLKNTYNIHAEYIKKVYASSDNAYSCVLEHAATQLSQMLENGPEEFSSNEKKVLIALPKGFFLPDTIALQNQLHNMPAKPNFQIVGF